MKRLKKKKSKGYLFESWTDKKDASTYNFPKDYNFLGKVILPTSINSRYKIHKYLQKKFPGHDRLEPGNEQTNLWWASLKLNN